MVVLAGGAVKVLVVLVEPQPARTAEKANRNAIDIMMAMARLLIMLLKFLCISGKKIPGCPAFLLKLATGDIRGKELRPRCRYSLSTSMSLAHVPALLKPAREGALTGLRGAEK